MKKRLILSMLLILLLAGGTLAVLSQRQQISRPLPHPTAETKETPHPLSRDAIAARSYPGGDIRVERDLGEQGGFRSYVVSYPSDGYKINTLMNVPSGPRPTAGWPVVIFNHGYFPPREYQTVSADYRTWTDGLARAGYMVLKPDYRGHAQSEGNAVGGNWAPDYTYDVLNLIASVKRHPEADGRRIGMFGHSMGGSITMRVITVSPDVKASVVIAGVVGSAEDLLYRWRRAPRPTPTPSSFSTQRQQLLDTYGAPKDNPAFWNSISPINYLSHVTGPVQIHHGAADDSVPKEFSDTLHRALQQAGKPVEYFEYPGVDHTFTGNGGIVLQRMISLFNRHVKSVQ